MTTTIRTDAKLGDRDAETERLALDYAKRLTGEPRYLLVSDRFCHQNKELIWLTFADRQIMAK